MERAELWAHGYPRPMSDPAPVIQRFHPGLERAVVDLILPIQREEFGLPLTIDDQPDLLRIAEIYQRGRGDFWTAMRAHDVVGTIALLDFEGGGALRKMFVRRDQRGTGLAQSLLDTLLAHARACGIERIVLGTTSRMKAAARFYERNGFVALAPEALPPAYPRMSIDDRFYARRV